VDFSTCVLSNEKTDIQQIGMKTSLDGDAFTETLRLLIAETKFLQNNPRLNVFAEEQRACKIVTEKLKKFSGPGGPLVVEELEYVKGRPNLKITYKGKTDKTVAFVGSHFDVVPADPETWSRDPFKLTVEGDKMYGRGTTDCLGHVAMLTHFMYELAASKAVLERTVVVCFIAAEEGGQNGVGVDMVIKHNKLSEIKNGPVYWMDCADSQPCIGSAGSLGWTLKAKGRLFHSGWPHKGINSIELANVAMERIQERFYEDFPPKPQEETYLYAVGSSMKPTQIECQTGSYSQICPETTIHGDIRLSPFYDIEACVKTVDSYVNEINAEMSRLPTRGPFSKFVLGADVEIQNGETRTGLVELAWQGTIESFLLHEGVACDIESQGFKALAQGCREVFNDIKPFSVNGTLPLVKQMQREGFDLQMFGCGLLAVYHGIDEYCLLSEFKNGYELVLRIVAMLDKV